MEGVVLYIMLIRVFAQIDWKYYTGFALFSYGKATVTVCISYSVEISYQVVHYCIWRCVFHWDWQEQMSGVMEAMMCKKF